MSRFKMILNNQNGVALMLVLASIVILTAVMTDFSLETHVNKLKAYNVEDKSQARLTAEAGLTFAMARLKLYKEAFNYVEQNEAAKNFASQELLNSIWNFPFIYPIPVTNQMNPSQRELVKKFMESSFIKGKMQLTIKNISQQISLNLIRVSLLNDIRKQSTQQSQVENQGQEQDRGSTQADPEFSVETQLVRIIEDSIRRKSDTDEEFASRYFGLDTIPLINNLKIYMSDPAELENPNLPDFNEIDLTPKKAPMTTFSEIYTIPRWDDDLVELIRNEFTVHGSLMVDLNTLTNKLLRILIPGISEDEEREFFEYRDDPDDPKYFNTINDFKSYIVNIANIMSQSEFDERFTKFEQQGLRFGPSPTLFQVQSVGEVGRATYNLTAYVIIPAVPDKIQVQSDNNPNDPNAPFDPLTPDDEDSEEQNQTNQVENNQKQKTQLLEPRIVEILIN